MAAMRRLRFPLVGSAVLLVGACAAHQTVRAPAPVATKPVAPIAAKPPGKPHAEKDHAGTGVEKNTALPAGEVGYYLDVLHGRLQQRLDPAVTIGRERGSIVLDLSRRLGFAVDDAQLDDAARALLLPLTKVLDEYRAALVSVRVSAGDDTGDARKLAQQRANGIMHLLTDSGIAAARVVAFVPGTAARDGYTHVEIVLAPETRAIER
jgi:outer membrane protein OmpA-like peptidoglycan-associated protein